MSALGHKRTFAVHKPMSALPPIADIRSAKTNVRFVPIADIPRCLNDVRFAPQKRTLNRWRWNVP